MKLATTTADFSRYFDSPEECIKHVVDAGFRYLDMSFYGEAKKDSRFFDADWRSYAKHLREYTQGLGARFVQAHSPGGNPLAYGEQRQLLVDATIRSIEVCEILGIPNTVVHAGWRAGIGKEEYFQENLEFYRLLFPTMERCGVNVLIENSTRANMGENFYFFTGSDMREFLEYAGHERLGACWDTGHANIEGAQYEEILALGDCLKAVHINDNRGEKDEHILPFCGTVNMDEIMHALMDVGFQGSFTFECDSTLRPYDYWLGNRRRFAGDKRLKNAPLDVMQKFEEALFLTGKYILSTYGCSEAE
ncbi:MAG: sugar phosphate isomerase/epimerase family protein [Eubacteriales bacterium]